MRAAKSWRLFFLPVCCALRLDAVLGKRQRHSREPLHSEPGDRLDELEAKQALPPEAAVGSHGPSGIAHLVTPAVNGLLREHAASYEQDGVTPLANSKSPSKLSSNVSFGASPDDAGELEDDDIDQLIADSIAGVQAALDGERKRMQERATWSPKRSAADAVRELQQFSRVMRLRQDNGVLPECKAVYDALLANEIDEEMAAWDNALVPEEELLDFLDAIDQPTNPLFMGASPYENIRWYAKDHPESDGPDDGVKEEEAEALPDIPALVEIEFLTPQNVMIVGDLHGRLGSLRRIHKKWLHEGMPFVVGLGDMVDRGNRQLEVAVAFLAWRCMFPDRVMVLHGNHERWEVNLGYGLECVDAYGPHKELGMFKKLNAIFNKIPTALVIRQRGNKDASGVFMHGGFGKESFEASREGSSTQEVPKSVLFEMQWNEKGDEDCSFSNSTSWFRENKDRGGGPVQVFCELIGYHFLKNLDACTLFTGHSHINRLNSEAYARTQDDNMENPEAVASSAGCTKMAHHVTLSAHRFFQACGPVQTATITDCQGKVTMMRTDGKKVEIAQENLFGCQGNTSVFKGGDPFALSTEEPAKANKAEKALDVGVGNGVYPGNRYEGCRIQPTWYLDGETDNITTEEETPLMRRVLGRLLTLGHDWVVGSDDY